MTTYVYWLRGEEHHRMALTSIASVHRADPRGQVLVYTDDRAGDPWVRDLERVAAVGDLGTRDLPPMLANLEAQCRAIVTETQMAPMLFLDADTIMLERFPFNEDADLFTTWRDKVGVDEDGSAVKGVSMRMPYNYGVFGANATYNAVEAFLWLRERVRKLHPKQQAWYGNQLALADLCGPPPTEGSRVDTVPLWWTITDAGNTVRVAKLPCERWNYTPCSDVDPTDGRGILHFKGQARDLMPLFAYRLGLPFIERKEAA